MVQPVFRPTPEVELDLVEALRADTGNRILVQRGFRSAYLRANEGGALRFAHSFPKR